MQHISITQAFNAPKKEIFDYLSDHNNLSSILGAQIKRIKDADGDNPNGLGSVRSIGMGIELLQETVTKFEAPDLIEYQISNKVPINYHLGRLEFTTPSAGKTVLNYTIDIESKFGIIDPLVKFLLENTIKSGLKKLASKYN